jgi:hypothetical protein
VFSPKLEKNIQIHKYMNLMNYDKYEI